MQSLGILATVILLCGLLFLVVKWPQSKHLTFSDHAAAYMHTIIYYNVLFTIVLSLLVAFFITWFVPTFHLSFYFLVVIITACILQYIVTVIPRVGGWKTQYHDILAACSATLLVPAMGFVVFSNAITDVGRTVAIFSLLVMLGIIFMFVINRREHKYFLLLQTGYFAAFFGAILVATYF